MADLSKSAIEAILKGKNARNAGKLAQELYDLLKSDARTKAAQDAVDITQYERMKSAIEALNGLEQARVETSRLQAGLDAEHQKIKAKEIADAEKELKIMLLSNDANAVSLVNQAEHIKSLKIKNQVLEDNIKLQEGAAGSTKRIGDALKDAIGYSEDFGDSIVGSLSDMIGMAASGEDVMGDLIESMNITKIGMVENAIEKTGEALVALAASSFAQMKALDAQQASFRKATGLGKEYDQMMKDTYEANKLNGVSMEENAQAMGDLAKGMTDFTMLGENQQKMLTKTAGILQENGVASATFAANTQIMNKGLGMGAEDAAQFNTTMVAMAKDIGMAPQELAEGFGELSGTMSALSGGSEAAQTAMRGLSATSKATGIAMGRIVDITSQFDTFEGASESVGALNAMLGGDFVNAMDVMAAEDPAERFSMMQQALDDAGKSFDTMTYYEKKAIAESMGLKDTNELAMLMSGNMDQLAGDFGKTSDEILAMEKSAKANQSVAESFQQLMSQMAPTFQFLIDGARGFVEQLQKLGPALPYVGLGLGVLYAGLVSVRTVLQMQALLKAAGLSFQLVGNAGFMAGMKIMAGFAVFIIVAALIYKVYSALGPLAGGFTLLGIAAVIAGIAIATGLTTATGGLYLIIPAIVLAVAGLIGVLSWLSEKVGGVANMIKIVLGGAILYAMGPIGLIIGAGILLYKNFDKVVSVFAAIKNKIVDLARFVFPMLAKAAGIAMAPFRAFLQTIQAGKAFMGAALKWIGVPGFADGGTSPGGPILVGEEGPEIISPPKGTEIMPNTGNQVSNMLTSVGSGIGNWLGVGAGGAGGGGAQEVNLNVTLELDGRELGSYIKKVALPLMNPVAGEG